MSDGKNHYAEDMTFPLWHLLLPCLLGFEGSFGLTGITLQYIDVVSRLLVDHREIQGVEGGLFKLQSHVKSSSVLFKDYLRGIGRHGCIQSNFDFWIRMWKTRGALEPCHVQTQRALGITKC